MEKIIYYADDTAILIYSESLETIYIITNSIINDINDIKD